MASDDTKFSHITLHADDDDEFVIQAGIRPCAPVEPASAPATSAERDPERVSPEAPVEAAAGTHAAAQEAASGADDGRSEAKEAEGLEYRETTAEDLKAAPMSGMQKIIIAAALLCVIGSVAYYMFFMR